MHRKNARQRIPLRHASSRRWKPNRLRRLHRLHPPHRLLSQRNHSHNNLNNKHNRSSLLSRRSPPSHRFSSSLKNSSLPFRLWLATQFPKRRLLPLCPIWVSASLSRPPI